MSATAHAVVETPLESKDISAAEIAAFLDGRLEGEELRRVEAILASNAEVRQEMIKASRIVASAPAKSESLSSARWLVPIVAVAAAAALLVMVRPQTPPAPERVSRERPSRVEGADHVLLLSPTDGSTLSDHQVRFTWRGYNDATYTFHISDETGHIVFSSPSSDTSITVDLTKLGVASGKLYWQVDALAANGSSLASGFSSVQLSR